MSTSGFSIKFATAIAILAMALMFGTPLGAPASDTPWGASDWTMAEFQPNIPNGGRANTIAVKPKQNDIILVASESGGLFKTTDGGGSWKHVDRLAPYFTNAVAFVPGDPKVVIVTTSEDFSQPNQGGIWAGPGPRCRSLPRS